MMFGESRTNCMTSQRARTDVITTFCRRLLVTRENRLSKPDSEISEISDADFLGLTLVIVGTAIQLVGEFFHLGLDSPPGRLMATTGNRPGRVVSCQPFV